MSLYGFIRGNPRVMRLREIEAALRLAYRLEPLPEDLQAKLSSLEGRESAQKPSGRASH